MIRDDLILNVEAALLAAGRPVAADELVAMFEGHEDAPDRNAIRDVVAALSERWEGRSLEVSEVASGFRAQIRKEYSQTISALWQERPARYSRALLETLALIVYRQPVSRGEIEEVRGVSISSSIMKTLVEREWVRVIGHRDVPGRPALYGTTKHFLDAFNLKNLAALPPLPELRGLEDPPSDLFTGFADVPVAGEGPEPPGTSAGVDARAGDAVVATGSSAQQEGGASAEDEPESAGTGAEVAAPSGEALSADRQSTGAVATPEVSEVDPSLVDDLPATPVSGVGADGGERTD